MDACRGTTDFDFGIWFPTCGRDFEILELWIASKRRFGMMTKIRTSNAPQFKISPVRPRTCGGSKSRPQVGNQIPKFKSFSPNFFLSCQPLFNQFSGD